MKIKKLNHILFLILSFLSSAVSHMRIYLHLPYRPTEEVIKATDKNLLPVHPGFHIFAKVE